MNIIFTEDRKQGVEAWLSESSEDTQIQRLAIAAAFVENLRKEIYETTHFRCSAGISFNKVSKIFIYIYIFFIIELNLNKNNFS